MELVSHRGSPKRWSNKDTGSSGHRDRGLRTLNLTHSCVKSAAQEQPLRHGAGYTNQQTGSHSCEDPQYDSNCVSSERTEGTRCCSCDTPYPTWVHGCCPRSIQDPAGTGALLSRRTLAAYSLVFARGAEARLAAGPGTTLGSQHATVPIMRSRACRSRGPRRAACGGGNADRGGRGCRSP